MIINLLSVASVLGFFLYCIGTKCYEFYVIRKKMSKIPTPASSSLIFGLAIKLMTLQKKGKYTELLFIYLHCSLKMSTEKNGFFFFLLDHFIFSPRAINSLILMKNSGSSDQIVSTGFKISRISAKMVFSVHG